MLLRKFLFKKLCIAFKTKHYALRLDLSLRVCQRLFLVGGMAGQGKAQGTGHKSRSGIQGAGGIGHRGREQQGGGQGRARARRQGKGQGT